MNLENNMDIEIRKKITNILKRKWDVKFSVDEFNAETLNQLDKLDGINVDFNNQVQDIIFNHIVGSGASINAFAYALNLYISKKYRDKIVEYYKAQIPNRNDLPIATSSFIEYLINNNCLQELPNPHKGCLVIYFGNDKYPKHAAIVESEIKDDMIVRSKWGTFKPIITHRLWHVPCQTEESNDQDYGTCVKYYYVLEQQEAEKYYLEYIDVCTNQDLILQTVLTKLPDLV